MMRYHKSNLTWRDALRIVLALAVATAGLLQFFDFSFPKACLVALLLAGVASSFIEVRRDFRRKRPRRKMRDLMLMCLVLIPVFGLMLAATVADGEDDVRNAIIVFSTGIGVVTVTAVWSFLRWRRLRAEAAMRLWQLRQQRKKRNRS